jgi:hypothetical protein
MNNMRELLKKQIELTEPCNGDYLGDRTIEEMVANCLSNPEDPRTEEEIRIFIEGRIELWKQHEGDRLLYIAEQIETLDNPRLLQIVKIWESELDTYTGKYIRTMPGEWSIPLFEKDI